MTVNLNRLPGDFHEWCDDPELLEPTESTSAAGVTCHFNHLPDRLIELIDQSDAVFGCVAWLTHRGVLQALARKKCNVVVQREDWLRPDTGQRKGGRWAKELRGLYRALKTAVRWAWDMPGSGSLRFPFINSSDPKPVVVFGSTPEGGSVVPRMHHKFMVFAREEADGSLSPYAVWTGSFNMTYNGSLSCENAVVIEIPEIVDAYARECRRIFANSSPPDWDAEYSGPYNRMGDS